MSRRKREHKRVIYADPKFNDKLITKFINVMMWHGKRSISENTFYGALDFVKEKFNEDGVQVFRGALDNVRPLVEVRSRRVGGATYQVPTEVRPDRANTLAVRWLIQHARSRSEKSMRERLGYELYDAYQNRGNAVKKKEDTHKMAEANRAFAHYRW